MSHAKPYFLLITKKVMAIYEKLGNGYEKIVVQAYNGFKEMLGIPYCMRIEPISKETRRISKILLINS
jgi:hypothetical protein